MVGWFKYFWWWRLGAILPPPICHSKIHYESNAISFTALLCINKFCLFYLPPTIFINTTFEITNTTKMKLYVTALCAGSFLFFSCANEQEPATDKTESTTQGTGQTTTPTTLPPTASPTFAPGQQTATPQSATPAAAGMNPEHGQPGHRCDIAVGAPLNSPPAAQPAVTTTPTFNTQPVQQAPVAAPPAATAPGMNPPHGQPGHDCAVAVGAPLNK